MKVRHKILVVDDELHIRRLIRAALERADYAIVEAENAREAAERLRAERPVYYNPERDFWALSRYDDVRAAFRDTERLSSAWGVTLEPAAYTQDAEYAMSFLAMDDPRHLRIRRLVAKAFTPKRMAALRPWIEERNGSGSLVAPAVPIR